MGRSREPSPPAITTAFITTLLIPHHSPLSCVSGYNRVVDQLFIEGIEFYGYHGVPDAEQQIGHRYRVDLVLELDLSLAGHTDQLEQTVDYGAVARLVQQIGSERSVRLMETLAERFAQAILERFPPVQRVHVRVAKRLPPTGTIVEMAGVAITRSRAPSP
jgi:dihydroneopterin aldolase